MKQDFWKSITEIIYLTAAMAAVVLSALIFLFGETFYPGMPAIFLCGTYMFLSSYRKLRKSKKEGAWVLPLGIFYFFLAVLTGILCITSCITNW